MNKKKYNSSKGVTGPSPTGPSSENVFWFDCGRSYQTGVILSLMKVKRLSFEEFKVGCQLILIRYIDAKRDDVIQELYKAFLEGYEKGETAKDEGLKMIPWGMA